MSNPTWSPDRLAELRLAKLRKDGKPWSQRDLGEAAFPHLSGVSARNKILRFETYPRGRNATLPNAEDVCALCEALGCTPDELFGVEND